MAIMGGRAKSHAVICLTIMQGRIYISSAFTNLKYVKCKPNKDWLDNDPHFWNSPPTWGICRTDFRKMLDKDDYIFYVLPKKTEFPQMIYGYIKVVESIPHVEAYERFPQKRMKNKNPNGNIIVDENGNYNRFDNEDHKERFEQIKNYYVVGDKNNSKFLKPEEIIKLSKTFLSTLQKVFNSNATDIFSIIGRKGRILDEQQIIFLLKWLN